MNPDIAMTAITSVVGLFGLWIAVYYLWRDFRNDAFRDDIFSVRDRMFLYAAQGNISFEHPAYTILRNRMNALLRHGHEFTLTRLVLLLATGNVEKDQALIAWESALAELPSETQEKLKDFNVCVTIFVLQHVVFFSFFRYIILRPAMFLVHLPQVIKSPKVANTVETLESATIERDLRKLGEPVAA
jgi:hypothetical protein